MHTHILQIIYRFDENVLNIFFNNNIPIHTHTITTNKQVTHKTSVDTVAYASKEINTVKLKEEYLLCIWMHAGNNAGHGITPQGILCHKVIHK